MKKFIDRYEFNQTTGKKLENVKKELFSRIEKSDTIVLNNNLRQNSINLESKKLEWMMFPMLPVFRATIEFDSTAINKTGIKVELKGNALFCFFKYTALFLFTVFASIWIINLFIPVDEFFNDSFFFSFGALSLFFILNFLNRNHIKTGYEEMLKLVDF